MMGKLEKYLHYYKPYKWILLGVMFGSCCAAVMDLLFPILVRQMLNEAIPNGNLRMLVQWAGALLLLYVANFALLFGINYYGHVMSMHIENDMRRDLFGHIEAMSFRFFDNARTGQLLSRITSDIVEVSELTFRGPNDVFVCGISMVGTIAVMLYMNPLLGGLISALLLVKTVHTVVINKKMKACFRRSRQKAGEVSAQAEEALSGIRLTKAFANEELELGRFMAKSKELMEVRQSSFGILSYFSGMVNFFTNFTNLAVLVCGGWLISRGQLTYSDFVAFFLYVNLFMKPILRLMVFTEMYQRGMAGFQRFQEMMATPVEICDAPNAITSGEVAGHITFENVCFSYLEGSPILKNFSLEIEPGQKVAFVGATGAGKSTLANLLLRFYEPQGGRILLDGRDIKEYQQSFLRRNIGLVQQDVFLFSDSARFNIAYANGDATDAEVEQAARLAAADEFIQRLPEGYATKVGERGVKLSGGQKQRLSIARAFLKNPPVLVLDEATSALDNKTEQLIQGSLDFLAKNRTTLIIAHRLTTIINADKIVVLQNGEIVEIGTHQELMASSGVYKHLYESNL
ncbi:MAG: ABC transporter ATP-binding protein [Phascolarctobacterium sp.]|nr:ABC transporter ATP-binding protein [Phascolarctobacterium sp.]